MIGLTHSLLDEVIFPLAIVWEYCFWGFNEFTVTNRYGYLTEKFINTVENQIFNII